MSDCLLQEAEESMEEDTPGVRRSNSAPDLHVMLQQPLQSMPRMLLGPQQQPLGSSSAVGALVPYTATSTKVRQSHTHSHSHSCRLMVDNGLLASVFVWMAARRLAAQLCGFQRPCMRMQLPDKTAFTSRGTRDCCALAQGGMLF